MRPLLALALAGCNAVLGLEATVPADAPSDAEPPRCEPGVVPVFSKKFHQLFVQACTNYTPSTSGDTAGALCQSPEMTGLVGSSGPAEGPLTPMMIDLGNEQLEQLFMFPEGDRFVGATINIVVSAPGAINVWANRGGTWVVTEQIATQPFQGNIGGGAPSRGPHARVLVALTGFMQAPVVQELEEEDDGSWKELESYAPGEIGVDPMFPVAGNLTADGLHRVFEYLGSKAPHGIYYNERATLADRFGPPVRLDGVPAAFDAYMTEDCARVYFSGLGTSIFYAQRE